MSEDIYADFENRMPHLLIVDLCGRCDAGCRYCFNSSTPDAGPGLDTETIRTLIEDAADLGIRSISWEGGEPLYRPDWAEILRYARRRGIGNILSTSCAPLTSARIPDEIAATVDFLYLHFDSIDRADYLAVRDCRPDFYDRALAGIDALLGDGFPRGRVGFCNVLTRPVLGSLERTYDWIEGRGLSLDTLLLIDSQPTGFGGEHTGLHCSPAETRDAFARLRRRQGIRGDDFGRFMIGGKYYCATALAVSWRGAVKPCSISNEVRGNVNDERLAAIFARERDYLMRAAFREPGAVSGPCGDCRFNRFCWGCRVSALNLAGDLHGSDPRCWLNPASAHFSFPAG